MADHICPVWVGYLLLAPFRKWFNDPQKILWPYLNPGMTAIDAGCAMGYFSLPMAEMVGPTGKVICVDKQKKMLDQLEKRARKAGLAERIEARLCPPEGLGIDDLTGKADFACAFYVVHETPDPKKFLEQIHAALRPGGLLLCAEPAKHVTEEEFAETVSFCRDLGFKEIPKPQAGGSLVLMVEKPG